jgi:hypothetical protein
MTCGTANPMTQEHPFSDQWAMRVSFFLSPNREEDAAMTATTPPRVFRLQLLAFVPRAHKSRLQPLSPLLLNFACAASIEVFSLSREHPGSVTLARTAVGGTPVPAPSSLCCGIRELRLNPCSRLPWCSCERPARTPPI